MTFRWKIAQAAEIRWWQRYLKNKPTADYAVWKTDYWQILLAEIGLSDLNTAENTERDHNLHQGLIFAPPQYLGQKALFQRVIFANNRFSKRHNP